MADTIHMIDFAPISALLKYYNGRKVYLYIGANYLKGNYSYQPEPKFVRKYIKGHFEDAISLNSKLIEGEVFIAEPDEGLFWINDYNKEWGIRYHI
jgi:hypothetical protein